MLPGGVAVLPELASLLVPTVFVTHRLIKGYAVVKGEAFLHLFGEIAIFCLSELRLTDVIQESL